MRQGSESNSERNINQHITYTPEVAEEMTVVAIILYAVAGKNYRLYGKPAHYMSVSRVVYIVAAISV